MNNDKIKIYTDGSCLGNPGKGGWGAILIYKNHVKEISGFEVETTNNKMEILSVINALKLIKSDKYEIEVFTDSQYVRTGITEWIFNWKKKNWRGASNKPIKNIELWQELDTLTFGKSISWHWVKAHNGDFYNEKVDNLARQAASCGLS